MIGFNNLAPRGRISINRHFVLPCKCIKHNLLGFIELLGTHASVYNSNKAFYGKRMMLEEYQGQVEVLLVTGLLQ